MTFTVMGYTDDVDPYTVVVDPSADPDPEDGVIVHASPSTPLSLLRLSEGEQVEVPRGPVVTVDLADPLGVLAGLTVLTQVTVVDGDAPDLYAPEPGDGDGPDEPAPYPPDDY